MNATSRNMLSTADRMSTIARQQQQNRDRKQHAEVRAQLTDQDRHQQWDRNREQHVEARARLIDLERQ
ncbi:unnamed protein product [Sphagnum tenellum]